LKTGLNPNATILNIDTIDLDPSPSPSTKLAGLDTNSNFEIPSYTSLATSVQSHPQTETSSSGSSTQFEKGSQSPRIKADTPISNYQDSVSPISSQLSEVPNQIRLSPIIKTLCRQFQANSQKSPTSLGAGSCISYRSTAVTRCQIIQLSGLTRTIHSRTCQYWIAKITLRP
jgi:hypothetical protein